MFDHAFLLRVRRRERPDIEGPDIVPDIIPHEFIFVENMKPFW